MNQEHNDTENHSKNPMPRPVPRAGLGHEEAWRAYESDGVHSDNPLRSDMPSTDMMRESSSGDAIVGDDALPPLHLSDSHLQSADLESSDLESADLESSDLESSDLESSDLPDPATIPELAPLAAMASGGAAPPPDIVYPDEMGDEPEPTPEPDPNAPRGEEQDIWTHLGELRVRILHAIAGVLVASVATWHYGQQISDFFARPIRTSLKSSAVTGSLVTLDPTEGFLVYFQITIVAAILLSAPWILYQMWRFIEPALTRTERRFTLVLLPFSMLLFFTGCALGYAMAPLFFQFFIAFQPPGTIANFGFSRSIALLAKMILVFGVCFQVPVIIILLNKIGLISRNLLIEYWRHAVVVIFIIVAILTPTWDPLSLMVCAVPPCLLYGLSIWMVKWL